MLDKLPLFFGIVLVSCFVYGCGTVGDCSVEDGVVVYKEKEYKPYCKDVYGVFVPECTEYGSVGYKAVLCPGDLECGSGECKEVEE